jgi:hypothetical protein
VWNKGLSCREPLSGWPRTLLAKVKQTTAVFSGICEDWVGSIGWKIGVKRGPARPASRELTFALVRWRSANVPYRKSKSARALPSPSDCGLGHRRKRSQKLSGIDYVAATIQLAGREPPTFDCSVDCRLGDAYGGCCTAWCVHIATCALRKTPLSCSHAVVKDQLSYAAEQRRRGHVSAWDGRSFHHRLDT